MGRKANSARVESWNDGAGGDPDGVQADGWYPVKSKGGHRQFKHPTKAGRVTIPGKPGKELPPGTLASIKRQAGLA